MSGFCVLVLSETTVVENLDNQIHFGWLYIRSMDEKGIIFRNLGNISHTRNTLPLAQY
jgi:hypothetical protein